MKVIVLLALFVMALISPVNAQNPLPESIISVGAGVGMPYGGIGTKTIIGYRNSGLLVGLGYIPGGTMGYEFGLQIGIKSFYLNLGYGVSGTYKVNDEPMQTVHCGNFMAGYMINLNKPKTIFFDIGVGHTVGAPTVDIGPYQESQGQITVALGVGFRF